MLAVQLYDLLRQSALTTAVVLSAACLLFAIYFKTLKAKKSDLVVSQIFVYPIKSCLPIHSTSATIDKRGFEFDRIFMLVSPNAKDPSTWDNHHITTNPRNALIRPRIEGNNLIVSCTYNAADFQISLRPDVKDPEIHPISMHSSDVNGFDMGPEAEDWFTKACGVTTKLIYLPDNKARKVLGNVSQGKDKSGITFADCASYLIASQASLDSMSEMLGRKMDMLPLRPNIVVASPTSQLEAWSEDYWSILKIGSEKVHFDVTANCGRCASLDVSYETGTRVYVKGVMMPLKSLMATRRVDPGSKYSPIFGRYSYCQEIGSTISVGDSVAIAKKNKERTVFSWPGLSTDPK